jgi:ATP-dependent DNA helicase Q1
MTDFRRRKDYKHLHIFKQYFPHTPIMALSATCPPIVLNDLIKILKLKAVVNGERMWLFPIYRCPLIIVINPPLGATPEGTVYFSAPLYRKNLHYKVIPKSSSAAAAIQDMADYILQHHPNDSGIVYCCSKKVSVSSWIPRIYFLNPCQLGYTNHC